LPRCGADASVLASSSRLAPRPAADPDPCEPDRNARSTCPGSLARRRCDDDLSRVRFSVARGLGDRSLWRDRRGRRRRRRSGRRGRDDDDGGTGLGAWIGARERSWQRPRRRCEHHDDFRADDVRGDDVERHHDDVVRPRRMRQHRQLRGLDGRMHRLLARRQLRRRIRLVRGESRLHRLLHMRWILRRFGVPGSMHDRLSERRRCLRHAHLLRPLRRLLQRLRWCERSGVLRRLRHGRTESARVDHSVPRAAGRVSRRHRSSSGLCRRRTRPRVPRARWFQESKSRRAHCRNPSRTRGCRREDAHPRCRFAPPSPPKRRARPSASARRGRGSRCQ
jgi:hypothetical protein